MVKSFLVAILIGLVGAIFAPGCSPPESPTMICYVGETAMLVLDAGSVKTGSEEPVFFVVEPASGETLIFDHCEPVGPLE